MKIITSCETIGAKAYYTGFDPRIIQYKHDKNALYLKIEHEIKCLLLTKNNIVCAASHLTSPFVYNFFVKNPLLLNSGVIIPALRSDLCDFYDLLDSEKSRSKNRKKEYAYFYNNNVPKAIRWELYETSEKFRKLYLNELTTPNSVLRRNLKDIDSVQLDNIIREIQNQDVFSRGKIDNICLDLSNKSKKIVRDFRELIYNIAGANILNCESVIPQQCYLDYSDKDIKNNKIYISPEIIFLKFFLENIYNSLFETVIPTAILDFLTFEDIFAIREIINQSDFIEKYNRLTQASLCIFGKDSEKSILSDMDEILKIREELQKNFLEEIEKELKVINKKKIFRNISLFAYNSIVILSSLLSFLITPIGFFSAALTAKDTVPNIYSNICNIKHIENIDVIMKKKEKRNQLLLNKMHIKNNTELYDIAKLLNEIIKMKLESIFK